MSMKGEFFKDITIGIVTGINITLNIDLVIKIDNGRHFKKCTFFLIMFCY